MHGVLAQAESSSSNPLIALAVIAGGFVLGSIAAAVSRRLTSAESRPEVIRSSAGSIATLAFSIVLIASLLIALGMINGAAVDQLLTDTALFFPKVISAAIVVIVANIFSNLAEMGVARSLGHVSPTIRQRVPKLVKMAIMGFALIIAANQLGINTTIVLIAVAALLFGISLASAMLAGLGGRSVAEEVAAGRAVRRELKVGDTIRIGEVEGDIAAIGSTSTQITGTDRVTLIPNSEILGQWIQIMGDGPSISLAPPLDPEDHS